MVTSAPLAMALLCRDESDIIAANIRFHARAGVDAFFVMDNGSEDGTRDILEDLKREVSLTIIDEPKRTIDQDLWMMQLALIARERYPSGFIILNDADEFWRQSSGNLKSAIFDDDDVIITPRRNMVWRPQNEFWADLTLRTESQERLRLLEEAGPTGVTPTGPKIICRLAGLESIAMGNHDVTHQGNRRRVPTDLLIRHYPLRSWPQFERKVRNYSSALINNDRHGPQISAHFRRWHIEAQSGCLANVFETRLVDRDAADKLILDGVLVEDIEAPSLLRDVIRPAKA